MVLAAAMGHMMHEWILGPTNRLSRQVEELPLAVEMYSKL